MAIQNQSETNWVKQILKDKDELLGIIVGIVTSITFILTSIRKINIEMSELLIGIDILNVLVLIVALTAIKSSPLAIDSKEFKKLILHLNIKTEDEGREILTRVNVLIKQLVYAIRMFAVFLCAFYLFQLFVDTTQQPYENIKVNIGDSFSILELLAKNGKNDVSAAKFLSLEILTNSANLLSAAYLFLAFQILFLVTIEDDNKTWMLKGYIPISIAIFITFANIAFFIGGFFGAHLSSISHVTRLVGGIYNGVAMFLLFSRFISMEYFFQNSRMNWQRKFYFYGTVIILPLYVVAQPLYGLFNAVEIGESATLFKSIVFLVCFWGKLVFLLFVFTMLNKKWIHAYLFMVLSQKDTLNSVSIDLRDVDDL